jgi:mediator of RNA polymerase II transcription subunit 12
MRKLLTRLRNSNRALKCGISSHLREIMVQQGFGGGNQHTSTAMLTSVRTILEATEDFTMLSEVVQCCLKSSDAEFLAACADTVNANLSIFLALGSAPESFNLLVERLRMFSQQGAVPRPLLAAVCHLAQRMPGRAEMANQLRQDLLQSDRSNAIDACSPVSDSMVPQAQAGEGELSEEIDKLLATGNRIDHPTMNRLFRTIVPRLEAGWAKGDESCRAFASLLTKMRVFDTHHFDKLMSDWISHVRSLAKRPRLPDLYPLLVTAGCLTVSALLHTANASPPMTSNPPSNVESTDGSSATYLQELLALILTKLPKTASLTQEEVYRFHIYQEAARSDNAAALLALIRNTIAEHAALHGQQTGLSLPLDSQTFRDRVLDALRILVVADAPAASEALSVKGLPQGATCLVSTMTTKLLLPGAAEDCPISFDQILGLATELTLPFCQLKLEFDLSVNESNPSASEDPTQSRFGLFSSAMDRAIEANNITWTSILPCLSGDISQHLKGLALGRLISLIPSLKSRQASDAVSDDHIHLAANLLGVVEAITTGQTPAKSPQLTSSLVDKLCDLCEIVAAKDRELDDVRASVLEYWLPAVLRLIILQGKGSESASLAGPIAGSKPPAPVNHEARGRIVIALCSLLLELQRLPAEAVGDLAQQVIDVAILLVDDLPDDLRQQCAKNTLLLPGSSTSANLSSDPRLYYLLSTPQLTPADNLVLSHRDKSVSLQSSGPRGMGAMYGIAPPIQERLTPFVMRRWEMLSESTPNIGENDTSLSLGLFEAIKIQ